MFAALQSAAIAHPHLQLGHLASHSAFNMPAPPAVSYAPNAEIFAQGEPAGHLYQIASGVVRACRLLADGRRQISAFYLPGEVFGLEPDGTHHVSAEAVIRSRIASIRAGSVARHIAADDQVPAALWAVAMRSLMRACDHLMLLGRASALERVAAFILDMMERQGTYDAIELPMTRLDIADYLGLTLETVSRMFAELKDRGAIRLPSARRVELIDIPALEAMSV